MSGGVMPVVGGASTLRVEKHIISAATVNASYQYPSYVLTSTNGSPIRARVTASLERPIVRAQSTAPSPAPVPSLSQSCSGSRVADSG